MFKLTISCSDFDELEDVIAKLKGGDGTISLKQAKALNATKTPTKTESEPEPEVEELFDATKGDVKRVLTEYKEEFEQRKAKFMPFK